MHSPYIILRRRARRCQAFTLTEIMTASSIGSLMLAGVLTTYVFSIKGFRAIAHYAEIHAAGRHAIDVFARDMRAVNRVVSASTSSLSVTVPTSFNSSGGVSASKTVNYWTSNEALYRSDSSTGQTSMLATNVYQTQFQLYDRLGTNTALVANAKAVRIELKLRKHVISQIQSEDYLSARLDMRNKP